MTDEEKQQHSAFIAELDTVMTLVRARNPTADESTVRQAATGLLLFATLPTDEILLDTLAMLRDDLERRKIATYATLSVSNVGEIDLADEDRDGDVRGKTVTGAVLTGTHDQVRRMGSALYQSVVVEIPTKART